MRIVINGWFSEQLTTGSGQYLTALLEWLPRVGGEHEFVVVSQIGKRERRNRRKSTDSRPTTNHAIRNTHHV